VNDVTGLGITAQPESEAEDRDLIARMSAGDRMALDRFYRLHHVKVYRFVRQFLREDSAAEDVANDIFIEVWRKASLYEGRSRVTTWLLGMARYKALSARRFHRETIDPGEALAEVEELSDTPEVALQKADKAAALKRCVAALSEEHRVVVDLVYYHEMSIAEVAAILEVPEGTVKTRMFNSRKKLSAMMAQAGLDRGWP
jgi:RNA polymerase sigma-70 factor (ECF subfamily)